MLLLLTASCERLGIENPFAARVGLRFLTEKQVLRDVGKEAGEEAQDAYIEQWVDENLWLRAARNTIRPNAAIRRQVKDYRRRILVNEYLERELRKDFLIGENDILEYYQREQETYRAKDEAVFIALYNCKGAETANEIFRELKAGNRPSAAEHLLLYQNECNEAFRNHLFGNRSSGPLSPLSVRGRHYVIFVLERYAENAQLRLEHVREDIIQKLQIEAYMNAYQKRYKDLKEHVNVKIY